MSLNILYYGELLIYCISNYLVIKANVLLLCKWILVIRSWLIFGYIWYFHCFYFQITSYLRNGNKLVVKILWLQGPGATQVSLASAASRAVLRTQDTFMNPQGRKDHASQRNQNRSWTPSGTQAATSASCFHCSILLESPLSAHQLFQVFLPLEVGQPLHSSRVHILHWTGSARCPTLSPSHSKF